MKDNAGDSIRIDPIRGTVYVTFSAHGDVVSMFLSPDKARKFIKKINNAIKEIENNG